MLTSWMSSELTRVSRSSKGMFLKRSQRADPAAEKPAERHRRSERQEGARGARVPCARGDQERQADEGIKFKKGIDRGSCGNFNRREVERAAGIGCPEQEKKKCAEEERLREPAQPAEPDDG